MKIDLFCKRVNQFKTGKINLLLSMLSQLSIALFGVTSQHAASEKFGRSYRLDS